MLKYGQTLKSYGLFILQILRLQVAYTLKMLSLFHKSSCIFILYQEFHDEKCKCANIQKHMISLLRFQQTNALFDIKHLGMR